MKAIGRFCHRHLAFITCRSCNSPFHPRAFATIAGGEPKFVIFSPRQSGAILKDTNSIMRSDKEPAPGLPPELNWAVDAALDKKAQDLVVIDVAEICSFTDNFIICTG